jgi:hypothetical protein
MAWQRHAPVRPAPEGMAAHQPQRACVVMGPQRPARPVSAAEVRRASTAPAGVEGGGRCRQTRVLWVSSLFGTTPSRMQG